MFCPSCGNKINENEVFCSNCGHKKEIMYETLTDKLSRNNPLKPFFRKIKSLIIKYRKILVISIITILILIVGILLFNKFYDFSKINWNKNTTGFNNVYYVTSSKLELEVSAHNKEKETIDDIKFKVDSGEIVIDGTKVTWTLPKNEGKYNITASLASGKKITKKVTVVSEHENLYGVKYEEDKNPNKDSDSDGLIDTDEVKYKTNLMKKDTDKDGLIDIDEIQWFKTNPIIADTDGDELNDGDEVVLGLNPLKADSKEDGIKDGNRKLTYKLDDKTGVKVEITGRGNIANTSVDVFDNKTFERFNGLLTTVYDFHTYGNMDNAIVKIPYSLETINGKNIVEDNLTIFYFNEETKKLEKIETTIDKDNKLLIANLKHFSKYVVGDKNTVVTDYQTHIMFVIDNSISMYTEKQILDLGFTSCTGCDGNDSSNKRISLSNKLIDMFTGNYMFGAGQFAGNYTKMSDITSEKNIVKEKINNLKSYVKTNKVGTNIVTALNNSINAFKEKENNNYMIFMTDGKNTEGSLATNKNRIIEAAKAKNIKICIIGLGSKIDTSDLESIASTTGCGYYNASNESVLDEVYAKVGSNINFNLIDTDNDNNTDSMISASTGFVVTRDGFSFENFSSDKSSDGHCYGMALFSQLYYNKQLPMTLDDFNANIIQNINGNYDAKGYNLNNTYFSKYGNLYDFEFKNEALKLLLRDMNNDYRNRVENNNWYINQKYMDIYKKADIVTISFKKYTGNNKNIKKLESATLAIDKLANNKNISIDEGQLFTSIWRLFVQQKIDGRFSFDSESDEAYTYLLEKLKGDIPVVTIINNNHAINATKLIIDNKDSNKFKIEVYDNNYPSEIKYVEGTRKKYNKFQLDFSSWTNEYEYSFTYDNKPVTFGVADLKL